MTKVKQTVKKTSLPNINVLISFDKASNKFKCVIDGNEYLVADGDCVIVPAGAEHNIINVSATEDLKMYTIYSPAHHKDGIVRTTKAEAVANEEEFDGVATE